MHASSSEDLSRLELSIGYHFKRKPLLIQALTHKSYAHEHKEEGVIDNERLEFLGDAILNLIISEYLYNKFKDFTEAELSRIKAYAVKESTLAKTARKLKIGKYLYLGRGEEITGGRNKPSLLANAFEAILAAIYLDGGYKNARIFLTNHLIPEIEKASKQNLIFDFKTRLQEISQTKFGVLPKYVTTKEEGPDHEKVFEVKVYLNEQLMGTGIGSSKKTAAQKAAQEGLRRLSADEK